MEAIEQFLKLLAAIFGGLVIAFLLVTAALALHNW